MEFDEIFFFLGVEVTTLTEVEGAIEVFPVPSSVLDLLGLCPSQCPKNRKIV